jgi:hypothetical protein
MERAIQPLPLRARVLDIVVRALLPFLGIAMLASGLVGVLTFGVLPLVESMTNRGWVPVEATVERASLAQTRVAIPLESAVIDLQYRYEFAGVPFTAAQYGPHAGLESRKRSQAFVEAVEPGSVIMVWVDRDDPARAMVRRDLNWQLMALSLPALVLCVVGFLMVLAGMMVWNDRRSMFRRFRTD